VGSREFVQVNASVSIKKPHGSWCPLDLAASPEPQSSFALRVPIWDIHFPTTWSFEKHIHQLFDTPRQLLTILRKL